jgi:predicted NACHT family NTPase
MIVLGEVGMGKTTSLVYLHLRDSEKAKDDINNHQIPIYIELKNMVRQETLLDRLITKIGLNRELIVSDLKKGKFNIYLDGLNEIEKDQKNVVITEIRNLIETYPNNFYLLSSRPQSYSGQFDAVSFGTSIPIFQLLKMNDSQMNEFLNKNCNKNKEMILNEIGTNYKLKQIVSTPLMLAMLVSVVSHEGNIPRDKAKILRAFMNSLYVRETTQEATFQTEEFHLLLCCLGFQSRNLTGANSGLNKNQYIIPILQEEKQRIGIDTNILDFIRKAMDLNILVSENDYISFTHEIYQEYYAAEYLLSQNGSF